MIDHFHKRIHTCPPSYIPSLQLRYFVFLDYMEHVSLELVDKSEKKMDENENVRDCIGVPLCLTYIEP